MRKVIYSMLVSLDGYIADAKGDFSWSEPDEELHRLFNNEQKKASALLYGRRMYELMADFWPTADQLPDVPDYVAEFSRDWRDTEKVVFSTTLDSVGPNARLVRENVAEEVAALKAQPGGDMSVGGAGIAASFTELGLIDEYRLYIHPVAVGAGKPMLQVLGDPLKLKLVGTRAFDSGVVELRYQPD